MRSRLATVFSADLRSLAAFRVVLAGLVLFDLGGRAFDLTAHYTDAGVLTRAALLGREGLLEDWVLSVNLMDGGTGWQVAVFVVAAVAALAMLVGFYTRLATIVVWALVVSIEMRNPLLIGGGEVLLRLLLFWGMFLPLGACWSLDRRRESGRPAPAMRFAAVPTAALFLQIAFVYWFAVILKSGPEWRFDGTAVYYALGVDELARPLGEHMWSAPGLVLKTLTYGTLVVEALAPFLLLSPFFNAKARLIGIGLLMSLHLGIWLTLGMGIFPFVAGLSLVCFVPGGTWDRLAGRKARPGADAVPVPVPRAASAVVAAALAYVLLWNVYSVAQAEMPRAIKRPGLTIGLSQRWDMFAPSPLRDDGWFVVPGTLRDGRRVDVAGVLRGDDRVRPISRKRPRSIRATYAGERWRKYLEVVRGSETAQVPDLGRFVCRRWNANHGDADALVQYQIVFMSEATLPDNRVPRPRPRLLWVDNCA